MKLLRSLLVGLVALAALAAVTSSASAALAILPVTTTATSGGTTLADTTAGISLTCTASSLTDIIAADGSSTIRPAVYRGCTGPGGAVTVTQNLNWTNRITALLNASGQITGYQVQITVPLAGVTLSAAGGLCRFDVSGTITVLTSLRSPVTPPALATVSTLNVNQAGLTILNTQGLCGLVGVSNNDRASYIANYNLSPAVSGTLR